MFSIKNSLIIGIILLGLAGLLVFQQCSDGAKISEVDRISKKTDYPIAPVIISKAKDHSQPQDNTVSSDLKAICNRWKLLSQDGSFGEALLENQRSLGQEAVTNLGPSDELLEFLHFLEQQGDIIVRDWVIKVGAADLFIGTNRVAAREWVVTIKDRQLREAFCDLVGQTITGSELQEYLHNFGIDKHGQSSVLTGFCRALAKSDPDGAVNAFMKYRPSGVDMSGLTQVIASMPATTDFANLVSKLPGDSKTLAKNARTCLLATWAANNPQEAAQYVINNSSVAYPSQLGNVVGVWAKTQPDAAFEWVAALTPGVYRDEGMLSVIRRYRSEMPATAWQYVNQIDDKDKRLNIATVVLNEWIKTDRESALKAWLILYPKN